MKTIRALRLVTAVLGVMLCAGAVQAAQNSAQRVQAFAVLPDWTGLWEWSYGAPSDASLGEPPLDSTAPQSVAQIVRSAKLNGQPPYNAAWDAKYQAARKAQMAEIASNTADEATSKGCKFGFPAQMEAFDTFELLVEPHQTVILFNRLEARHIYTDGRTHPAKEDLWPTAEGDSIGHWEGETLVVDTIARKAGPIGFFATAAQLSDQAHFIERIRMVNADELENQMTIEDSVAFVRPWRLTIRYQRIKDLDRFIEFDCAENDRNPIVNGRLTITAP